MRKIKTKWIGIIALIVLASLLLISCGKEDIKPVVDVDIPTLCVNKMNEYNQLVNEYNDRFPTQLDIINAEGADWDYYQETFSELNTRRYDIITNCDYIEFDCDAGSGDYCKYM